MAVEDAIIYPSGSRRWTVMSLWRTDNTSANYSTCDPWGGADGNCSWPLIVLVTLTGAMRGCNGMRSLQRSTMRLPSGGIQSGGGSG